MLKLASDCVPGDPICFIGGIGEGIGGAISFGQDPFGSILKTLKEAARGLAHDVLPALTGATLPQLDAPWFLAAYAISFASAIFVAIMILIPQFVRTARGLQGGRELVDSVGIYFMMFLVGAMFGPAIGLLLVNFFHALSNSFIAWGVYGSTTEIIDRTVAMIGDVDPAVITGGVFIACVIMLLMVIGLFLVILVLIVQLVTLYFVGVLIPLGLVWIIDPNKRSFGLKLVGLWIGILAAHPLLFFLLGFAYNMMTGTLLTMGGSEPLEALVGFVVCLLALYMATLSPLLLLKFAPVIPTSFGGSNGPDLRGGGSNIGSPNMSDASAQYGQSRDEPSSNESTNTSTSTQSSTANDTGQPAEPGLTDAAKAAAGAEGAEGAAGAGAAASGAGAAEGLAATGAAESVTGVGAVVGVPTMLAAAGMAVVQKVDEIGQAGADQATGAMDDAGGTIGEARP